MLSRTLSLPPGVITGRSFLLVALVCGELILAGSIHRVPDFTLLDGQAARLMESATGYISVAGIGAFLVASLATFLLLVSRRLGDVAGALHTPETYRWETWLALHGVGFAACMVLSWQVFGPSPGSAEVNLEWLAAWLLASSTAVITFFLAIAPFGAWQRLAQREGRSIAIAATAGVVAWAGGKLAQVLWLPLTELTLWCTHRLLALLYADVYVDPERAILAVNSFAVEIAPACSGYEGMALITIFVSLYLWLFRAELEFPRALTLFPIGITVIWIANVLRITVLIVIGASVSPDIAVSGFHSQAGWIGFSVVALGVIALAHRYFLAAGAGRQAAQTQDHFRPAAALLAPLLALMATSMVVAALSSDFAALYPLSVIMTTITLWHFRACYKPFSLVVSWQALAIGALIGAAWLAVVGADDHADSRLAQTLNGMPVWLAATWIVFRVIGSVVTVPIAEELAFRGYLIRKLVSTNFEQVTPGRFTWLSFTLSSLLFGLLHDSWLAGTLAGAGYAGALYWRGRIADAVVAHMTSNALIAATVLGTGRWGLWG